MKVIYFSRLSLCSYFSILQHDEALIVAMSRRKDEENKAAGAEAFRGATVGAAKVEKPHYPELSPLPCSYIPAIVLVPNLAFTDTVAISVGSHRWWTWCRGLLPVSHLSRIDSTIQSVCSSSLTWSYPIPIRISYTGTSSYPE